MSSQATESILSVILLLSSFGCCLFVLRLLRCTSKNSSMSQKQQQQHAVWVVLRNLLLNACRLSARVYTTRERTQLSARESQRNGAVAHTHHWSLQLAATFCIRLCSVCRDPSLSAQRIFYYCVGAIRVRESDPVVFEQVQLFVNNILCVGERKSKWILLEAIGSKSLCGQNKKCARVLGPNAAQSGSKVYSFSSFYIFFFFLVCCCLLKFQRIMWTIGFESLIYWRMTEFEIVIYPRIYRRIVGEPFPFVICGRSTIIHILFSV